MRELFLLLSRYPYDKRDKPALEMEIRNVHDWKKTVELINTHGIIALSAYNINESGLHNIVPPEAMSLLNNGQKQNLIRNIWLTQKWKELNSILTEAGIKHVLLKGMDLEHTLYGGKGLRQMSDNDILVKKEDAMKAWILLKEKGFKTALIASKLHMDILTDIGFHLPKLVKDNYVVEVHHSLVKDPKKTIQESQAIDNSNEIFIDGVKAYVLPNAINQAFLKEHLLKHLAAGQYQFRLSNDIRLLSNEEFPEISADLICTPERFRVRYYKQKKYKSFVFSLSVKNRWKYLIGDILPSLSWMQERYKCNLFVALFHYPMRFGKLLWLFI